MAKAYNKAQFDPPAPVITVRVFHPDRTASSIPVDMQLDSGSDITCIPAGIEKKLPHLKTGWVRAEDYDGSSEYKKSRFIGLKIDDFDFPIIEAVEINGEMGLLGRDILNQYRVMLDGKKLEFNLGEHQ